MTVDAVALTQELIAMPSPSQFSNQAISLHLCRLLEKLGFITEQLRYTDPNGEAKMSIVAKLGIGPGGLGLFSHTDTVPGGEGWEPFTPAISGGKLYGRGACDMKGPLAATIAAANAATARIDPSTLRAPLYIVLTADEEVGYPGAYQVVAESQILAESWPAYSVVAEPTELQPVYAHKGGVRIHVTAYGRAAHTSTDLGVSANFLIAPFLAEMADYAQTLKQTERYMNHEFNPPTNGFNMVIDDGNCKANVTAAKTVCTLSLRAMPNDHREEVTSHIHARAQHHNLEFDRQEMDYFYSPVDTEIIQAALEATGAPKAITVPFGTEASLYKDHTQCVILGPGSIAQAHTIGEWIDVKQLKEAVDVYDKMIRRFCL
jgi:acetylornithine deacetylase